MIKIKKFVLLVCSIVLLVGSLAMVSSKSFALEVGDTVPCVDLPQIMMDGSRTDDTCIASQLVESQKLTLIEFFNTGCSACTANMPNMYKLSKDYAAVMTVRGVATNKTEEPVLEHIAEHRDLIQYPIALDLEKLGRQAYGIKYTPTVFIVNKKDVVLYKHIGTLTESDLLEIKTLVLAQ